MSFNQEFHKPWEPSDTERNLIIDAIKQLEQKETSCPILIRTLTEDKWTKGCKIIEQSTLQNDCLISIYCKYDSDMFDLIQHHLLYRDFSKKYWRVSFAQGVVTIE